MSEIPGAQKLVLIVDGDPNDALSVGRMLEAVGARVLIATDGADALELARRDLPDLILCEIDLPGMGGFDLRRELLKESPFAKIPFVFAARTANATTRLMGLRLGATDFLAKPIDNDILLARVMYHLEQEVPGPSRDRVSGTFGMISCASMLQCIESSRSSGVLTLESPTAKGTLTFSRGMIVDARAGNQTGEDAAFTLVAMDGARFSYRPLTADPAETVRLGVQQVLMEAVWLREELEHLAEHVPDATARIAILDKAAVECFHRNGAWKELVEAAKPGQAFELSAIAEKLGIGMLRCRATIARGVEKTFLRILPGTEEIMILSERDIISEEPDDVVPEQKKAVNAGYDSGFAAT